MTRAALAAIALAASGLVGAAYPARAQRPPCVGPGVKYVEWPERGPRQEAGRTTDGGSGVEYGIDINSQVAIKLDTVCLVAYLGRFAGKAPRDPTDALQARIDALTVVLKAVPLAIEQLRQATEKYATDPAGARPLVEAWSATTDTILETLEVAMQARLEAAGTPRDDATVLVDREFDGFLRDDVPTGYDWDVLGRVIEREILLTRAAVAQLRATASYGIELRAHLLSEGGQSPVPLEGYNDEAPCTETRVEPIELTVSPEQAALYERAEALERELGSARSIGEAILLSLRQELEAVRAELDQLLTRAKQAGAPLEAAAASLERWKDAKAWTAWLASIRATLEQDPDGAAVRVAVENAAKELPQAAADLAALRQFASLKQDLTGADARAGMQAILSRVQQIRSVVRNDGAVLASLQPATWTRRAELVGAIVAAVSKLDPALQTKIRNDAKGLVRDLDALHDAARHAADSLQGVSTDALTFVARVLSLPPARMAAGLPEPAGLRRRSIGPDLDTSIDLKRICAARRENDVIQVEYRFFFGERPMAGGWTDRLRLRVYGWRSRVAAGLAFAVRENTDTWRPGAAVSWVFSRGGWPTDGERGLGDPAGLGRIGFGLTAVNLHFEDDEAVELGIGPSISLLGDRIIFGGGWNLQAHSDHLYGLLSVRLLDIAQTR